MKQIQLRLMPTLILLLAVNSTVLAQGSDGETPKEPETVVDTPVPAAVPIPTDTQVTKKFCKKKKNEADPRCVDS